MNTISKLALVCAVTLFSSHVTYGMDNDNNQKRNLEGNQPEGPNKKAKTVSNEEIFDAARLGKVDFFKEHNGIDLTIKNYFDMTPLHWACLNGHTDIVKFIVEQDPELLKKKDLCGWTPLHSACLNGRTDIVKFIVKKDPELLKEKDNDGWTPLHHACWNGRTNIVTFIVETNPELLKEKNNNGETPLHYACSQKRTETIKFLLLSGADFNAVDNDGRKPLMLCEEDTQKTICKYMKEWLMSLNHSSLRIELCKHNKIFAQKVAHFMMSLKYLKKQNPNSYTVPKPIILMMVTMMVAMLNLNDEVDQIIQQWTTEDKNNNNN